jgi:gamma-glutamyl-gamma-aminobutyrate hydrolase PuuD
MKKIVNFLSLFFLFSCDYGVIKMHHNGDGKYVVSKDYVDARAPREIIISENTENLPVVAVVLGAESGDYYIYDTYVESLRRAQLYPVFISHTHVGQQLAKIKPAGILAVGGAFGDLHRTSITHTDTETSWNDMLRAYTYQIAIDYAQNYNLPYLGICAGMQELAIALGGKLAGNQTGHSDGVMHDIKIMPNTLMQRIFATANGVVNSYHSSVVHGATGGAYRVSATAQDGNIEAIEPTNPWSDFVLGVQWHPEKNTGDETSIDYKVFRAFANSVVF